MPTVRGSVPDPITGRQVEDRSCWTECTYSPWKCNISYSTWSRYEILVITKFCYLSTLHWMWKNCLTETMFCFKESVIGPCFTGLTWLRSMNSYHFPSNCCGFESLPGIHLCKEDIQLANRMSGFYSAACLCL
jgi:hypothetical protein